MENGFFLCCVTDTQGMGFISSYPCFLFTCFVNLYDFLDFFCVF